jgi:probable F420-dependent oxidoreductase
MRVGAVFPQTEIGADPAQVRAWATGVERLGFAHMLTYDHVLGAGTGSRPDWPGPYTSETMFHEVFVLLGYVAAVTSTLELATGVLILPQRQTALVAKQAAEVDVLSGGRLRLGVGVGWNPVEYEGLNESFGNRGARSAEQIEVLRALWGDPLVTYRGKWHTITDAGLNPLPGRRIPIWLGGGADATLRRAARLGDGWLPQGPPDDAAAAMLDRLWAYAAEAGRSRDEIGIEARLTLAQTPRADWAGYVDRWRELGATHLGISTMRTGLSGADAHLAALAEVRELIA